MPTPPVSTQEDAALVKPALAVAVSVNTKGLGDAEAWEFVTAVAEETKLPATDPFRASTAPLLASGA